MSNRSCFRCGATVHENARFCPNCNLFLPSEPGEDVYDESVPTTEHDPVSLVVDDYAISVDLEVCSKLQNIPVFRSAVEFYIEHWTNPLTRARLLGTGVRVGADQLPSLHGIAESASRVLKAPCPDFFIIQDPTVNAFTLGTNQDHIVIVHSGLLNILQSDELAFVISHEVGHIASRHVTYKTMAHLMAEGVGRFVRPLFVPIVATLNAWSRESELTADRAAFLCCGGDIEVALRSLLMLSLGSRKYLDEINLSEYLKQEKDLEDFYGKLNLWFGEGGFGYSHPYMVTRVRRLMEFACSDIGQALCRRIQPLMKMSCISASSPGQTGPVDDHKQITGQSRFCKQCGFEIGSADDLACSICGARVG